jgi:hypothetical protein
MYDRKVQIVYNEMKSFFFIVGPYLLWLIKWKFDFF